MVKRECGLLGIEPSYVGALILKESSGEPWKTRYEPGWRYFEQPEFWAGKLGQSVDTEMACQKMSWGLLQTMGGTARWLGFSGYLTQLLIPATGIHWGCRLFAKKFREYGDYEEAIAAYNAGSARRMGKRLENQDYVDSVLAFRRSIF